MKVATLLVLALAVVPALGACSKTTGREGREAELGEYAKLTPTHGAYVRMITAEGERWRATFNADTEEILIKGVWQKEEGRFSTMKIGPEPTARIWQLTQAVLSGAQPPWHHHSELRFEMALSDGDKSVLIKTQGPFADGPAKDLFDGIKGFVPDPDDPANKRQ